MVMQQLYLRNYSNSYFATDNINNFKTTSSSYLSSSAINKLRLKLDPKDKVQPSIP